MNTITLRPLAGSSGDLEFIRFLRNTYRSYFFDQNWILDWQQQAWWQKIKDNSKLKFYLIEHSTFRIGTISRRHLFSIKFKKAQIPVYELGNIMLHTHYQGHGYMHMAMAQLMSEPAFFIAHVKTGNDDSVRVFEKVGFAHIRRTDAP